MTPVLIALGSNVGDSTRNLQTAIDRLSSLISNLKASLVYVTKPMYELDQPDFLNAACSGETELGPIALLRALKGIEQEMGRATRERNGPREIDLDLIAYGVLAYRGPGLQIPHPRLPERRFVLKPVADVAPEWKFPGLGPIRQLLHQTESQTEDVLQKNDAILSVPGNR